MKQKKRIYYRAAALVVLGIILLVALKSCRFTADPKQYSETVSAASVEFGDQNTAFLGRLSKVRFDENTTEKELKDVKAELQKLKSAVKKFGNLKAPKSYKEADKLFQEGTKRYNSGIEKMESGLKDFEKNKDSTAFRNIRKEAQEEFSYGMQDFYNAMVELERVRAKEE